MNDHGGPRRQVRLTVAYIIMGLLTLAAVVIAVQSLRYAESGKAACAYVKSAYPASHRFRKEIKGFVHDHAVHLREEARAYRASAAQDPDAVTAKLDRLLAQQLEFHAATAMRDYRRIQLPGPPTCS